MSTKEKFAKNKVLFNTLIAVGLILILLATVYFTRAYPVVLVGNKFIFLSEVDSSIAIAKKLDPNSDKQKVYEQVIANAKKEQLVSNVDIADEFKFYTTGRADEYRKFLNDYFSGDEKLFKKLVVAPKAFDAKLAIKYNSNFGLNNDAYNKASNVISKLNEGQSFEELAKTYSDDKISGQLGGDLGFVQPGQLLPELEKAVAASTFGEVKKQIVISRLGYHIIFPMAVADKDGQKITHLKHILITTSGYENWLAEQLNKIGVHKFIGI
ncbi:MAG TPA: peptidylprolyl isomerase [Patescibacteria group bacterium]